MNNFNDQKIEEILEKTLEYLDSGKSPAEILNLFPEHRETLKEIFSIINLLKKEKESIIPAKELFKQIIEQIPGSVTNEVNHRYLYRGEIKGRPSIFRLENLMNLLLRMNKLYIGIGILLLVLVIGGVVFWQSQKVAVSPLEKEMTLEEEALDNDLAELETMGEETSLDTLDEDLAKVTEEGKKIETASIENLESELSLEMNGFSDDFAGLEGFESDASFDDLDTGLSGVGE